MDDLVDRLLNIDSHTDDPTTDRTQLTIHLYHAQLPKLADHGVVEFDPENRTVHYQGDEQLESVLDALPNKPSVART